MYKLHAKQRNFFTYRGDAAFRQQGPVLWLDNQPVTAIISSNCQPETGYNKTQTERWFSNRTAVSISNCVIQQIHGWG